MEEAEGEKGSDFGVSDFVWESKSFVTLVVWPDRCVLASRLLFFELPVPFGISQLISPVLMFFHDFWPHSSMICSQGSETSPEERELDLHAYY